MIVLSMIISNFVKICQVLTLLHCLICGGANFRTQSTLELTAHNNNVNTHNNLHIHLINLKRPQTAV